MPGSSVMGGTGVIACYCRVSSASQRTDSQKPEIRRWLDGNRIDPSTVCWFEDKETGKTLKRPAFDRLQEAIFGGTVTTVVVWKLDRMCPSGRRVKCEFSGAGPGSWTAGVEKCSVPPGEA